MNEKHSLKSRRKHILSPAKRPPLATLALLLSLGLFMVSLNSCAEPASGNHDYSLSENYAGRRNYTEMSALLDSIAQTPFIDLQVAGLSPEGRNIYLLHIHHGTPDPQRFRILLYGQQHGNEPAGKEAILELAARISRNPDYLPRDTELFLIPQLNPDGAERDQRRNALDADLNRDHRRLSQTETRILHESARRIMPQLAVDCHEFNRSSSDYRDKGWNEWPLIMMDCANNPNFPLPLYEAAVRRIHSVQRFMQDQNINFTRYFVGSVPPLGEQRYSTLENDDGRNSLGGLGSLSFIIESGVLRDAEDPDADLSDRVNAYLAVFHALLHDRSSRSHEMQIIRDARSLSDLPFIHTNYFWGNKGGRISEFKVIDSGTGKTLTLKTPLFMKDRIVKGSVPAPRAWWTAPEHAELYSQLLKRHAIPFTITDRDTLLSVRSTVLTDYQSDFDRIYNRYEDRQITSPGPASEIVFPAGSLRVPARTALPWRSALIMEPQLMFGIYEYPEFRSLVSDNGIMPVFREE